MIIAAIATLTTLIILLYVKGALQGGPMRGEMAATGMRKMISSAALLMGSTGKAAWVWQMITAAIAMRLMYLPWRPSPLSDLSSD